MEIKNKKAKKQKNNIKLNFSPDIRYLFEMKQVLYDKKWLKKAKNLPLYYMYRGVKKKNGLRYDITVIPPNMLGKEFVKTKGHEHCGKYAEIYQALKGKALYLLQKRKGEEIEDVYAVFAKKNEFVIIPPYYGHITINPTHQELKEANWVSQECKNIYDVFEKKQGACYYYLKSGWVKNKNYKKVPKLRFEKPIKKLPKNLDFLKG